MKGLLVKDLRILFSQARRYVSVLLILVIFMAGFQNSSFAITYLTIVLSVFAINTVSYDELGNGYCFLFTLPVTRRQYVLEKYLLGLALGVAGSGAGLALGFVLGKILRFESGISVGDFIGSCVIVTMLLGINLPIVLKFGSEKSRWVILLVYGAIAGLGLAVFSLMKAVALESYEGLKRFIIGLDGLNPLAVLCCAILLGALVLLASIGCSLRIISRKEF